MRHLVSKILLTGLFTIAGFHAAWADGRHHDHGYNNRGYHGQYDSRRHSGSGFSFTFSQGNYRPYYRAPRYVEIVRPRPVVIYNDYAPPAPVIVQTAQPIQNYCREYQNQVIVGGRVRSSFGTACLQPDGSWQVVD